MYRSCILISFMLSSLSHFTILLSSQLVSLNFFCYLFTSGNSTPDIKPYSDLVDDWAYSVCTHLFVLESPALIILCS